MGGGNAVLNCIIRLMTLFILVTITANHILRKRLSLAQSHRTKPATRPKKWSVTFSIILTDNTACGATTRSPQQWEIALLQRLEECFYATDTFWSHVHPIKLLLNYLSISMCRRLYFILNYIAVNNGNIEIYN